MNEQAKVLIIIPAYDEGMNIAKIIAETREIGLSYNIVVVNDGSEDDTEEIVKNMGISIISHPINLGAGAAIQTGLKYALLEKYDAAVIIDGDGQHDPKEAPKLIEALRTKYVDVVIGSRFLMKGAGKTSWTRHIGIVIFSAVASFIGRCRITDVTSGYRVFNQKAIKYLSTEIPADFPDADMLLALLFSGFKIVEIPVNSRERQDGQSMYSGLRAIYYPFKIIIAILAVLLRDIFSKRR